MNLVFLFIITILKWLKWTSNHHSNKAAVGGLLSGEFDVLKGNVVFYIFSMKSGFFFLTLNQITDLKQPGRKYVHSHNSTEYPQIYTSYLLMQSLGAMNREASRN